MSIERNMCNLSESKQKKRKGVILNDVSNKSNKV